MDFGSTLRDWRLDADLSLRELARKVGIDFTQLSKIETGVLAPPGEDRIRDLVAALGRATPDAEILIDLARQSNVPKDVVRAALTKHPEVGALLRRIKDRPLSEQEVASIKQMAAADTPGEDETNGPTAG